MMGLKLCQDPSETGLSSGLKKNIRIWTDLRLDMNRCKNLNISKSDLTIGPCLLLSFFQTWSHLDQSHLGCFMTPQSSTTVPRALLDEVRVGKISQSQLSVRDWEVWRKIHVQTADGEQ